MEGKGRKEGENDRRNQSEKNEKGALPLRRKRASERAARRGKEHRSRTAHRPSPRPDIQGPPLFLRAHESPHQECDRQGRVVNKRLVDEFQSDEIVQQSQSKKLPLPGTCLPTLPIFNIVSANQHIGGRCSSGRRAGAARQATHLQIEARAHDAESYVSCPDRSVGRSVGRPVPFASQSQANARCAQRHAMHNAVSSRDCLQVNS